MKFGQTLRERVIKEWRFYAVDYKALKKSLKCTNVSNSDTLMNALADNSDTDKYESEKVDEKDFFLILNESEKKLAKFYHEKENWALAYMRTLEQRVEDLRSCASAPTESQQTPLSAFSSSSTMMSLSSSDSDNEQELDSRSGNTELVQGLTLSLENLNTKEGSRDQVWLKNAYRRMGSSKHFQKYIYAKKSLVTFQREVELILEFLELNQTAFSKILKKFDKKMGTSIREENLKRIKEALPFLNSSTMKELREETCLLIKETNDLKPSLPEGWTERKVYTIGCFDLFHRGHQNVLMSLREFGCYIVAGIHDDESYFQLKNKYTIDNLETRMKNVKPFVDQLYVIPSTDPLLYTQSMVSQQDIDTGACCYARGDDMLNFPGREWIESVMPVHFVPRTEACSSTLIRTIYHAKDEGLRAKAAFAKTRYDGKPVDEDGNVLKLKVCA